MRWKWIVPAGAALIVAMAISAYLVLRSYDYNRLKPRIARMVAEATGRELTLGGDLSLDFGFSPALVITDVGLANPPWASDRRMITARRIEAKVALLPLLSGHVELKYLTLADVDVVLEVDADGKRNWAFTAPAGSAEKTGAPEVLHIAVEDIRVENLKIIYRDEKAARTIRFNLAGLEIAGRGDPDFFMLKLRAHYNGQPLDLSGRIGRLQRILSGEPFPLEMAGGFSSATVKIEGSIGEVLALQGIDLNVHVTGKNLRELRPVIDTELPQTDAFEIRAHLAGSGKSTALENISGSASAGGSELAVSGRIGNLIAFKDLNLQMQVSGKDLAQVGRTIGQNLPPTDEFVVRGRLTGSARALCLQDAYGQARRGSLGLEVTGAIKDVSVLEDMDLRLKGSGKELAEIGPLIGKTLPELGPFDLTGHLSGSAKSFSVGDLTAIVDRSDLNGHAKVEFRKRPKITLVLESSLLDLTALLKNVEKDEKKTDSEPAALKDRLFPTDPLPFDVLKQVDADISLDAKNVRARDANFEFGSLRLTLEDGEFNVDTLQATYKQTRISGNFHVYSEAVPRIAAKFLVQDFDLGGLLRELHVSEKIRSHLDIAVDVTGTGDSVHDLMAGLDGSVGAVMGEGYLTRYLDLLSSDLSKKVIPFWGSHHKAGEIKCAVVQFDISHGVATSQAFVFDTEIGVLTGEGEINLGTEQVKFLLSPSPRYPSLMSFATKLRVSGTIMDSKVRPDTLSLLSKGARALSALVVGPLGLLAPFVNLGAHNRHPCDVESIGK